MLDASAGDKVSKYSLALFASIFASSSASSSSSSISSISFSLPVSSCVSSEEDCRFDFLRVTSRDRSLRTSPSISTTACASSTSSPSLSLPLSLSLSSSFEEEEDEAEADPPVSTSSTLRSSSFADASSSLSLPVRLIFPLAAAMIEATEVRSGLALPPESFCSRRRNADLYDQELLAASLPLPTPPRPTPALVDAKPPPSSPRRPPNSKD
mmetsp:Transcript_21500/g.46876  ORF Transcript_21500/g.46876 Transcript_21500/m.46876 type:complete len:211 (+) Transcript_21500:2104-2736(+)